MRAGGETRAAVLAKALVAGAVLGASSLIAGRKGRRPHGGLPPAARGDPDDGAHSKRADLAAYAVGYALALALTCLAFALVHWRWVATRTALELVLGLALVQALVHFRCFLHVDLTRSSRDDRQLILFSALIILLMVGGTLVILLNLRTRMM